MIDKIRGIVLSSPTVFFEDGSVAVTGQVEIKEGSTILHE